MIRFYYILSQDETKKKPARKRTSSPLLRETMSLLAGFPKKQYLACEGETYFFLVAVLSLLSLPFGPLAEAVVEQQGSEDPFFA